MLATVFRVVITIAALFAVPIASFAAGHPVVYQIAEFVAALVALMLKSPLPPKPPEPDL